MEDPPGYMGTRSPRATDFSIAAIIGRSAKAAEVLKLKGRHGRFAGNNIRPLGKNNYDFLIFGLFEKLNMCILIVFEWFYFLMGIKKLVTRYDLIVPNILFYFSSFLNQCAKRHILYGKDLFESASI